MSDDPILISLASVDGVYSFYAVGDHPVQADAHPTTRRHEFQDRFPVIATSVGVVADQFERSSPPTKLFLAELLLPAWRLRVTAYHIEEGRTLVVFTKQGHAVSKLLPRLALRLILRLQELVP